MPRLRNVWAEAWASLPDGVHGELSARGTRAPGRRVVRVLFATMFGEDQPPDAVLEPVLRSPRVVFTDRPVESHDADRIRHAVAHWADRLEVTARIYADLRRHARAAGLSGDKVDEHLMRRALRWAGDGVQPTDRAVAALLAELQEHPTPSGLRELLDRDADLVERLGQALVEGWPGESVEGLVPDVRPLLEFLDDEDLDGGITSARSEEGWARAQDVDAGTWHQRTQALGLSETSPPARPPLRASPADEVRAHEWHSRWLDTSIEERVASALRRSVRERSGLSLPDLLATEVRRATQPLGLAEADSRTVLVLGAQVAMRSGLHDRDTTVHSAAVVGAGIDQVRASVRVRDRFRFWRLEQEETRGMAGFPKVWAGILADPTTFYLSYLWLRIHHDEVYGRAPYTAASARWAVVGIASTVIDRLKTLPASQPQVQPGAGSDPAEEPVVELHAGRTVALYFEVDRIRAGVDPEEFARFFVEAGRDPDGDRLRWAVWTEAARSGLALADVLDWLEEHAPVEPALTSRDR